MKADPATFSLFDIPFKCLLSLLAPRVWRVIQLDKQFILPQEGFCNLFGVGYIVNGKITIRSQFTKPNFRGGIKAGVASANLGNGNSPEPGFGIGLCR